MHYSSSQIEDWKDGYLGYREHLFVAFIKFFDFNCISLGFHIDIENRALNYIFPSHFLQSDTSDLINSFSMRNKAALAGLGFGGVEPEMTGRPAYHPSTLLKIYVCDTSIGCNRAGAWRENANATSSWFGSPAA